MNLPQAQDINLFPWLRARYEIWAKQTPEASRGSTLVGLAELALSGCTTVFDHAYATAAWRTGLPSSMTVCGSSTSTTTPRGAP